MLQPVRHIAHFKTDFDWQFFILKKCGNESDSLVYQQLLIRELTILGDPGAVSRVDKMSVVKVYCKIETFRSYCKLSLMSMAILQLSNHVVQTEEQMMHWDMLNKATKSEFSLSQCVTCSPVWRFFVPRTWVLSCKRPIGLSSCFCSFPQFWRISEADGSFSIVLTVGFVCMQL